MDVLSLPLPYVLNGCPISALCVLDDVLVQHLQSVQASGRAGQEVHHAGRHPGGLPGGRAHLVRAVHRPRDELDQMPGLVGLS